MMKISSDAYDIYVLENELDQFSKLIETISNNKRLYVITDQIVFDLYEKTLSNNIKDREIKYYIATNKDMKNYQKIVKDLLADGITKNDILISFGGGVVGDLTGFIASTLFRGISYIQIPTTLLSQIDSSIGGKTALDTKYGKNLIGSFYNPKLVIIDLIFLQTLSQREYNNGLVEGIKMALLSNEDLYRKILKSEEINKEMIVELISFKKEIVHRDPNDKSIRRILNFGHTFGHIIEKTNNYKKYKHGEAIAYGMLISLKIGEKYNFSNKKVYEELRVFFKNKKIIEEPINSYQKYKKYISYDKKNESDGLDFIFLEAIAKPIIVRVKSDEL